MLIKILDYIAAGKLTTTAFMADKSGLSEEMIKQALTELVAKGYLELAEEGNNASACDSCAGCAKNSAGRGYLSTWTLTAKGEKAIKKLS